MYVYVVTLLGAMVCCQSLSLSLSLFISLSLSLSLPLSLSLSLSFCLVRGRFFSQSSS
jgi:hypothetical protein